MAKQRQCFCGSKVTLVPAHDPTEGEVKSEVLDGLFLKIFFLLLTYQLNLNMKSYFNHQKQPK
jgi:hypothetical protein